MNQYINKKVIFRINNQVIGTLDADEESICDVENLKCAIACEHNVAPDEIDVEYKTEVIELAESFLNPEGQFSMKDYIGNEQEVEGLSFCGWVNPNTEQGMESIMDYITIGKADELIRFN